MKHWNAWKNGAAHNFESTVSSKDVPSSSSSYYYYYCYYYYYYHLFRWFLTLDWNSNTPYGYNAVQCCCLCPAYCTSGSVNVFRLAWSGRPKPWSRQQGGCDIKRVKSPKPANAVAWMGWDKRIWFGLRLKAAKRYQYHYHCHCISISICLRQSVLRVSESWKLPPFNC